MPATMSRTTVSANHAQLKAIAWRARERGRQVSWSFLAAHPERDTFARPAFQLEYHDDGLHTFSPLIVVAQRDRFFGDSYIVQRGLRAPSELAAYVKEDRGEAFARALRELARGELHWPAGNFSVVDGRIVPVGKKVA